MDFAVNTDPQALVRVGVKVTPGETRSLLAPFGLVTPDQAPIGLVVDGGSVDMVRETNTGQEAALIQPETGADTVTLTYGFQAKPGHYPDGLFQPHDSRFTRCAEELLNAATPVDPDAGREAKLKAVRQIVQDVHERFVYGHPEVRFNDGMDEVPYLSCGTTAGSCVDINTYLIACLRASGIEAGYITGYFLPEEKGGTCVDMHCWVATRTNGIVQEWDIAHYLKMGKTPVEAGLNPKPGCRVALFYGMGLNFPDLGVVDTKLLGEPVWVGQDGKLVPLGADNISIRMEEGFMEAAFSRV